MAATSIPDKYPAKAHALRVAKILGPAFKNSTILLTSTLSVLYPNTDMSAPFRQDRDFNYLTGAFDLNKALVTYKISADKLTLWLPPIDEDDVMWSGMPLSVNGALQKYDVDEVRYIGPELTLYLSEVTTENNANIITLKDVNHSHEFITTTTTTAGNKSAVVVESKLREAISEARAFKDAYEIQLMRKAAEISDNSHRAVMSALPIEKNEGHIHAEFVYHSMRQGSKYQAYDPICCSGTDCGTLHYTRNDQELDEKLLVLIDAGAEWQAYASDVTRVFPISGEWTPKARTIYTTVLQMQEQAMKRCAPGVSWDSLHLLCHEILVAKFLDLGIFQNGTVDEIIAARTSVAFFPHGLGHMLGMDTHDTFGNANYDDPDPMYRYLRIRRDLQEGFVVTVEPGIYFNKFLLEPYLSDEKHAKFINQKVLDEYMSVGGVRIEDDILITATGYENFTKITSDPDEVSAIVKAGINKGRDYFHVIV